MSVKTTVSPLLPKLRRTEVISASPYTPVTKVSPGLADSAVLVLPSEKRSVTLEKLTLVISALPVSRMRRSAMPKTMVCPAMCVWNTP